MKKKQIYEIEIHYKRPLFDTLVHIGEPKDAEQYLRKWINPKKIDHKEFFWILLLNRGNKILGFSEIGSGSDAGVVINFKEIFQLIIKTNSSSFIICHNHCSGNLKFSEKDVEITRKLKKISELMNVTLLDHLLLTSESCLSMMEENLL